MKVCAMVAGCFNFTTNLSKFFSHFVNLGIRYYIFTVFFFSGWLKTKSWDSTLFLFQHEYNVTWLPLPGFIVEKYNLSIPKLGYEFAAYLGTCVEIILPVLLLLGFGARLAAIALFIFNYTAVVSYPYLWTDVGLSGFKDHLLWGALIGYVWFYGPGKISLDQLVKLKCKEYKY